ncbi:hypothetical protein, partial [Listeria monocytogenes]|uniref:hypothetical protein n=1 Tax=Listeria monocytogenes TaxID=1639 RepID=UPI002FDBED6F
LYHADDPTLLPYLERLLRDPAVALVGQNIAYDAAVLCAEFPTLLPLWFTAYEQGRILDTKLREQLIDIASVGRTKGGKGAYGLENLVKTRL